MAANRLKKLILQVNPEAQFKQVLPSVEEAVHYFQNEAMPDILFMDVHLSDGISFELFDLVNITCPVVFTTAFDEYALDAFRVHAAAYLLKPFKVDQVAEVIHRLSAERSTNDTTDQRWDHPQKAQKILIKKGAKLIVLDLGEAAYYMSENKMTFYVDASGQRYVVDQSLESLERSLNANHFFRVSRQFIINRPYIGEMTSYSASRIKVTMDVSGKDDEIIVSKDKVSRFRKWLVEG